MTRLAAALAVCYLAVPAGAQQLDRRSRDEPEVVVEAGGRVGPCDTLVFDKAGKYLFAGGDDKVVRVWPVTPKGFAPDPGHARVLRWRAWREQRGGIKTVAVSPDGNLVAVGGFGMRPSTVTVIDRDTGDLVGLTWPKSRPGIDNFNAVFTVAFSPDGKRVGFGTADGSLWVWDYALLKQPDADGRPSAAPRWVGRHAPMPGAEFNYPRALRFDANTLVSVAQSGEVMSADLAGPLAETAGGKVATKALFDVNEKSPRRYRVHKAAWSADGAWLAVASEGPQVLAASTDGKTVHRFEIPPDHFPRSVAWAPAGDKLAVGVARVLPAVAGQPRFYAESPDELHVHAFPPKDGARPVVLAHPGPAEALAFHPDGRLAVAGGDADEVALLTVGEPGSKVVRGAGRRAWGVNISTDGTVIGVKTARQTPPDPNARAAGDWTGFDLRRLGATREEVKWVGPVATADGWRVEPDAKDRFLWHAVLSRAGMPDVRHPLTLDTPLDQAPTCYTFVPAKDGKPTRVIVGHYYGASLFELTPEMATRPKLYTGHAGEVLSVVAAADGTWFVTGGADHTVAAWSLADWREQPALGAAFDVRDGAPVVTAVVTGSPAWEAGLRAGDKLDLLAVGGQLMFDRRPGKKEIGDPGQAATAAANPVSGVEQFYGLVQPGQARRDTLTTVRQRPLWKWFGGFADTGRLTDWIVWSWHGSYYHTASAHGDRLVGWHVNAPDTGTRPEFYPLQQFEKHFHRPDVIEELVTKRDLGAALALARGENPLPVSFTQYEPAPVRLGLDRTTAGPNGVTATVAVRKRGSNVDLLPERVELWLNDHRVKTWKGTGSDAIEEMVKVPLAALRAGENQLSVVTFNAAGGRAEEKRRVTNDAPAPPTNLLAVSVGINDYSGHRKAAGGARALGDLTCADKDARGIADAFRAFRGDRGCFKEATVELRLDADATRTKLLTAIDTAAAKARPDDLMVVFFAGHGDLLADPKAPLYAANDRARGVLSGAGRFVLCGPDYARAAADRTGLSAEELFEALAKINCRKVVLLDACHSGEAAAANLVRRCVPDGHGPFVVASCDQGQLSYEHPRVGHGVFTKALLDALGPDYAQADADTDGAIGGDELVEFVTARLPGLLRQAGKPADAQTPICFPRQPPRAPVVSR
ncbi:caspase family protein [bacterium]|nr:caspase family protein [bacterium]